MLHIWDFMATKDFIALVDRRYAWLRQPSWLARLYCAASGDVNGEMLPPHHERSERQADECVAFILDYLRKGSFI